ncbi:hypothetical protein AMTRI_Chr06g170020 [Amborella trichopoda]
MLCNNMQHMAYQYAKRGACLVLVATREQHLREVAEKTRSNSSPEVLILPADVTRLDGCKRFIQLIIQSLVDASATAGVPLPRTSLYNETMRMEIGDEIGTKIATPGWTESELSKGKFMNCKGIQVDQKTMDERKTTPNSLNCKSASKDLLSLMLTKL